MDTLLTPLLARLTSATGFTFTTNATGDIVVATDDAFKLAAIVDFAGRCADIVMCFPDNLRETVALGSEVFPVSVATKVSVPPIGSPTRVDLNLKPWVLVSEPGARVKRYVQPDDTVMGQPRERVAKGHADKRAAAEQEKLAEAGRKSWVTRRANAAKKTKGGRK